MVCTVIPVLACQKLLPKRVILRPRKRRHNHGGLLLLLAITRGLLLLRGLLLWRIICRLPTAALPQQIIEALK